MSIGAGQSVRRNAGNTAFEAYTPSAGGGISIGEAITGATANRVLYVDGSGNLANDADFTFDGTDLTLGSSLKLPTTTGTAGIVFQNGSRYIHSKGTDNLFLGRDAGNLTNTASYNVGIGTQALNGITSGQANMAIGYNALYSITTQTGNFAVGYSAGQNCTGAYNSLLGYQAGYSASGTGNISIGASTMSGASSSSNYNVAIGQNALYNISGSSSHGNTAVGFYALNGITSGSYNNAFGYEAGLSNQTGTKNVFIGYQAGYSETGSNKLYIDNSSSSSPLIYGEFDNDLLKINGRLDCANFRVLSTAGDLGSPADGDIWYNSSTGKFRKRENGATSNLDTTGSGGLSDGDYGDITVSGSGTVMSLDAGISVTLANTGLNVRDIGNDHTLRIRPAEDLTANRVLLVTLNDADRALTIAADATISNTNTGDETGATIAAKAQGYILARSFCKC